MGAGPFTSVAAAAAALVLFAQAAAAPPGADARAARPVSSAAFSVAASNGFSLDVESRGGAVTVVASERRPPVATFTRAGAPQPASAANGAASIYYARAAGGHPARVDARLGRLGRISVSFRPSGGSRVTTLGPGAGALSCDRPTRIVRRLGTFVGSIEFRGEDGYTEVRAARARGSIGTPLPRDCAESASTSARASVLPLWGSASAPRRVLLSAVDRRAGTSFAARTRGPGVAFEATWRERLEGGVLVSRRAYAAAPRSAFSFDRRLSSARVAPPAPFSGGAIYRATGKGAAEGAPRAGAEWSGSLSATFPGVAVPMTGPGFRASLETAG